MLDDERMREAVIAGMRSLFREAEMEENVAGMTPLARQRFIWSRRMCELLLPHSVGTEQESLAVRINVIDGKFRD